MNICKNKKTPYSIMFDMIIVLLFLSGLSFYYYGIRAMLVILISVATCIILDFLCIKARHQDVDFHNLSAVVVTGLVLALMMPATVPYYIVVIACCFSILIGKHAFGGSGCELFNCALIGFVFVSICFPQYVLQYPKPFDIPNLEMYPTNILSEQTIGFNTNITSITKSYIDILTGNVRGAMGSVHILILLVSAIFLMVRNSISKIVFLVEFLSICLFSCILNGFTLNSIFCVLGGDMIMYSIIFFSCDINTIPKTKTTRLLYALIVCLLFIIIQCFEKSDNSILYAIILAVPFANVLDRKSFSFANLINKKSFSLDYNKHLQNVKETINLIDEDK